MTERPSNDGEIAFLLGNRRVEIRFRLEPIFDRTHEAFETPKAVELIPIAEPCRIEGDAEKVLETHRRF